MPIHIGQLVQAEVERQKLTQKEFGALINRNEKTVPDIYGRSTMATDLLVTISIALKKDFLKFYYEEDEMKTLRDDEIAYLKSENQNLKESYAQLKERLDDKQKVISAQELSLSLVTEELEEYKRTKNESSK
jgi:uncharacterized protein YlxW (UPF0749 family)